MANPSEEDHHINSQLENLSLSPETERNLKVFLAAVTSGEASLRRDSEGKVNICYKTEKNIALSHVDKSQAHTVQKGKSEKDISARIDVCMDMYNFVKTNRAPRGVVIDSSKAMPGPTGDYKEGKQYDALKEVLGRGNCAGDIIVVKDRKTGAEMAQKTVMISEFREQEVRAWVDLGDSESFPSLYTFQLDNNKVVFHMEKIEHGVTLEKVIDEHLMNLGCQAPEHIQPFSLCLFHGLLSAVKEMHDKNWTHNDLHSGNVMLTKDTMTLKILDFGMAQRLRPEGEDFNHAGLKSDVLNAVRLFSALYSGEDFTNNVKLEGHIKAGTVKKVLSETSGISEDQREELMQLFALTYQVISDPYHAGYGDLTPVQERIEAGFRAKGQTMSDVMKMVAALVYPEYYPGDVDMKAKGARGDVPDGPGSQPEEEEDFSSLEAAAAMVPDDFVRQRTLSS